MTSRDHSTCDQWSVSVNLLQVSHTPEWIPHQDNMYHVILPNRVWIPILTRLGGLTSRVVSPDTRTSVTPTFLFLLQQNKKKTKVWERHVSIHNKHVMLKL